MHSEFEQSWGWFIDPEPLTLEQNMQTQTFTPNLNRPFFKKSISNLNINSNEINFKLQSPKPNYKFKIIASGILLTGIKIGIMICMYMSKNE